MFAKHLFDEEFLSRLYKELSKLNKTNKPNKKNIQNIYTGISPKKVGKKHMKMCSTIQATREMPIKTTKYYHTPITIAQIKKINNTNY